MNKKLIKFTESDLHRIVKESVGKILKEGYYDDLHDYWGQEDEPNLICPYCESDNVQEVRGKDGSWDGSYRCHDCGKVFDIDSARGNNYFEPDWDAMRHESLKRNGKMLKEMDLNPKMSTHDVYGRGLSRKSDGPNWSRQRRRPMTQQQNLSGVNVDAINKVLFPDETPQMAKDQLKRKAQYGLMNPPSVKESDLHKIVKESVNKVLKETKGEIITCFGTREAITKGGYVGGGSILGDGVIYLGVGYAPEDSPYNRTNLISVNVDVSNFYRAKNAQEAIAIERDNQEGYSGVLYHSHHDGDVCVVFDQSCIIGKAF